MISGTKLRILTPGRVKMRCLLGCAAAHVFASHMVFTHRAWLRRPSVQGVLVVFAWHNEQGELDEAWFRRNALDMCSKSPRMTHTTAKYPSAKGLPARARSAEPSGKGLSFQSLRGHFPKNSQYNDHTSLLENSSHKLSPGVSMTYFQKSK